MNQLPNSFLIFNEKGVTEVFLSFSHISNFEDICRRLVNSSPLHIPGVMVIGTSNILSLFKLTGEIGFSIRLNDPYPLRTLYSFTPGDSFIAPHFTPEFRDSNDLEMGESEYWVDPAVLYQWGEVEQYLIWLPSSGVYFVWRFGHQLYVPPLPNLYEDGLCCLGQLGKEFQHELYWGRKAEVLVKSFFSSIWNQDLCDQDIVKKARAFFRWGPGEDAPFLSPDFGADKLGLRVCSNPVICSLFSFVV